MSNLANDTLLGCSMILPAEHLLQTAPRAAHDIVTRELAHKLAAALKEKIGSLYERQSRGGLQASYPAYARHSGYHIDSIVFGVDFHVMSKFELKAHVDAELKKFKEEHAKDLEAVNTAFNANVKKEAKRLLEKAAQ